MDQSAGSYCMSLQDMECRYTQTMLNVKIPLEGVLFNIIKIPETGRQVSINIVQGAFFILKVKESL